MPENAFLRRWVHDSYEVLSLDPAPGRAAWVDRETARGPLLVVRGWHRQGRCAAFPAVSRPELATVHPTPPNVSRPRACPASPRAAFAVLEFPPSFNPKQRAWVHQTAQTFGAATQTSVSAPSVTGETLCHRSLTGAPRVSFIRRARHHIRWRGHRAAHPGAERGGVAGRDGGGASRAKGAHRAAGAQGAVVRILSHSLSRCPQRSPADYPASAGHIRQNMMPLCCGLWERLLSLFCYCLRLRLWLWAKGEGMRTSRDEAREIIGGGGPMPPQLQGA